MKDMKNAHLYLPIIAAIQKGERQASGIIKTSGVGASCGYSRLAKLKHDKVLVLKKDGYAVSPGHEISKEAMEQALTAPTYEGSGSHPELARIERRITNWLEQGKGLIDEVRALGPLIVSPQERLAVENLRKSGFKIR